LSFNDLPISPNPTTSGTYPTPGSALSDPDPLSYDPTPDERKLIDEINAKARPLAARSAAARAAMVHQRCILSAANNTCSGPTKTNG
jgi:hypothetical protein